MKENLDGMDAKLGMMNVTKSVNQPRKSGFELLRIVAVVLIVAHHLVCHSGYLLFAEPLSVRRLFYQMCFMPFGKIGIALFLLISLWFLVDRKQTIKESCRKVWLLERELLFWGFVGLAVQYLDNPESVNEDAWLDAFSRFRETYGGMRQVMQFCCCFCLSYLLGCVEWAKRIMEDVVLLCWDYGAY